MLEETVNGPNGPYMASDFYGELGPPELWNPALTSPDIQESQKFDDYYHASLPGNQFGTGGLRVPIPVEEPIEFFESVGATLNNAWNSFKKFVGSTAAKGVIVSNASVINPTVQAFSKNGYVHVIGERLGLAETPPEYRGGLADPNSQASLDKTREQISTAGNRVGNIFGETAGNILNSGGSLIQGLTKGAIGQMSTTTKILLISGAVVAVVILWKK